MIKILSAFSGKLLFSTGVLFIVTTVFLTASCRLAGESAPPFFSKVHTLSFTANEKIGEPFGIAFKDNAVYFSDGETGKIWRATGSGNASFYDVLTVVSDKFDTPSAIAFDERGDLIVADSGTHTVKHLKIGSGEIELIAGIENRKGFADGAANAALFNAPVGIAVRENKIYVADTYNDRIRLIENGTVSTLAGSEQGFADGTTTAVRFDTPCGLAIWKDKLLVADTGNRRLRVVEPDGKTWTLSGTGVENSADGFLYAADFAEPLAVTVDKRGVIYVADGNSIRVVGNKFFPFVETLTERTRGFADGSLPTARFNRPSGLATDENGNLFVADAENQTIRVLTGSEINLRAGEKKRVSAEEFRNRAAPRWTYNPPERKREIAGTLGEIRGEIVDANSEAWFHNGLDIVGGYGETARFIRAEKVLHPLATENFSTLRELIRMPTIGYVHIRLGRDQTDTSFGDQRFQFALDERGKFKNVRVPRGAKFEAGEAIGTLNPMNHVHLVAGRTGAEMNALDALVFPGISDSIAPKIERIVLHDENWQEIEKTGGAPVRLDGKTRIVARAFDRMDGNAERRRLGVYKLGYQILRADNAPLSEINWTISFERFPEAEAVKFVYAVGSKSGATGETIFNYIVSNRVSGDEFREDFFDAANLESGNYILRVFAADFFGNTTSEEIRFLR